VRLVVLSIWSGAIAVRQVTLRDVSHQRPIAIDAKAARELSEPGSQLPINGRVIEPHGDRRPDASST